MSELIVENEVIAILDSSNLAPMQEDINSENYDSEEDNSEIHEPEEIFEIEENSSIIEDLASIILEKLNEDPEKNAYSFIYRLPIFKIDDIPVNAKLDIVKSRKSIVLFIDSNIIYNFGYHMYYKEYISYNMIKGYKYTISDFVYAINKVLKSIKVMKFDKITSKLSTNTNISMYEKGIIEDLFNFEHVKLKYDECSICGDITMKKTKCNHPLCYACQEQIKEIENLNYEEHEYFAIQQCPICRYVINRRQLNVDKI